MSESTALHSVGVFDMLMICDKTREEGKMKYVRFGIAGMVMLSLVGLCGLSGCKGNNLPFDYHYRTPNDVDIIFKGVTYRLNRYIRKTGMPFTYQFESDGDVDITINGRTYDIDSPYDIDRKSKKLIKKKSVKKNATKTYKTKSKPTSKSSSSRKSSSSSRRRK